MTGRATRSFGRGRTGHDRRGSCRPALSFRVLVEELTAL